MNMFTMENGGNSHMMLIVRIFIIMMMKSTTENHTIFIHIDSWYEHFLIFHFIILYDVL